MAAFIRQRNWQRRSSSTSSRRDNAFAGAVLADPHRQKKKVVSRSRIMKSKDGFVQAYNAQAAIDAAAQIIVALTQCGNDQV